MEDKREDQRRSSLQENARWWILPNFAADSCNLVLFKHIIPQTFLVLVKGTLGSIGHDLRPPKNLTGRKVSGGHRDGLPSSSCRRITNKKRRIFAWHGTTQPVGIYPLIWVDASWLWNCKLKKRASRRFSFFFFLFLLHCVVGDVPPSGFSSCSLLPYRCMPKQRSTWF